MPRKGAIMDFQEYADIYDAPTCIISVEKKTDGGYGDIRLVAGNRKYTEPFENPSYHDIPEMSGFPEMLKSTHKFIPNSLYVDYLPKDLGFENICYRAAIKKIPIHTYVHLNEISTWFDIFCIPLEIEDENVSYCVFTTNPCCPDTVGVSSSQSDTASEDVLKTCVKLHSSDDFKQNIDDVIKDIRLICRAEICSIMVMDMSLGRYTVLSANIDDNSKVKRVTVFSTFFEIAASWANMIGGNDYMIIRNANEMNALRKVKDTWYHTFIEAGVESFVLFPLRHDGDILGFIWAINFDTTNTFRIKETLELTTYFISSQLSIYKMMERLKQLSFTDVLTTLPNRFACTDLLEDLIKHEKPFYLAVIDINAFKSINDTMGFQTGNNVLIEIATRWKAIAESGSTGTKDYFARLGGDEFALIIHDYHSEADALKTIQIYEAALSDRLTIDDCDFFITASIGYASYPDDSAESNSLMTYATASMYEVKRYGSSNHILRFSPDLLRIERNLEVEKIIRDALENDSIYFNLQPQFDMDHKLRGFEALARLKDEKGNFVSPAEFIPVAEKIGLIDKVDCTVYKKSAAFFGELLKKYGTDLMLSINVSVRHLMKNDFFDEVREVIELSGIPASNLEIEITESIMIDSAEKALRCIEKVKEMGINIAIDDFGTGYSALSYLNTFPADILKIDKSFIDKMNTTESSTQYVAAIISMGHIMGFEVISEGVEEPEQIETLRSIGCDYIQGFIWGRPLSPEDAMKLVSGTAIK